MKKVVFIACVSKKRDVSCKARELYISSLFKKELKYAEDILKADDIYILSAKYGLVQLNQVIEPYNKTLNNMKEDEIRKWSRDVLKQIKEKVNVEEDEIIFLAGQKYRKYLIPHMKNVKVPMEGLGIGKQLQFLERHINE